jgi:hypothetical protein
MIGGNWCLVDTGTVGFDLDDRTVTHPLTPTLSDREREY